MSIHSAQLRPLDSKYRLEDAVIVGALDSGNYHESSLSDWLTNAPRHLLANNLGIAKTTVPSFKKRTAISAAKAQT
jgi:oxalate decarboxylase